MTNNIHKNVRQKVREFILIKLVLILGLIFCVFFLTI